MDIKKPESRFPLPPDARKVFSGEIFDVYQWDQEMFDGSKRVFEKLKRPDTVVIIPVTKEGKILLVTEQQPNMQPKLKVPTGRLENGEDPLRGAQRELLEETGYAAGKWKFWKAMEPITKMEWVVYLLIAQECEQVGRQNLDPGEKITFKEVTWEEFVEVSTDENFFEREITFEMLKGIIKEGGLDKLRDLVLK